MPPIYVCIPDTPILTPAKIAQYQAAFACPHVGGANICNPLTDGGEQFAMLVGMFHKPFCMDCSAVPALPGVPSFVVNTISVPKIWAAEFGPAVQAAMGTKLAMIDNMGLTDALTAVTCLPVQPYANGEMGYACENGIRGQTGNTGRNDAVLAQAGWTPAGYKAGVLAYVTFLNAHPVMAGKALKVAFFTADNWPRVNQAGQVVDQVDSLALSTDLLDAIVAAYTTGPVWYGDTTFETAPSAFVVHAGLPDDRLVFQVHATGMTRPKFDAAIAAMPADAARWEVHPGTVDWLGEALHKR